MDSQVKKSYFDDPNWYKALTLSERARLLGGQLTGKIDQDFDSEYAQRHLERWLSQAPFGDPLWFAKRLEADRLTEDQFLQLLGRSPMSYYTDIREMPEWLRQLESAFSDLNASSNTISNEFYTRADVGGGEKKRMTSVLNAIAPLCLRGKAHFHQEIEILKESYSSLPFDPESIEDLVFSKLPSQLLYRLSRTMVLELNVARLQGVLKGDTPEERFENFADRLHDLDVIIPILQEYPVLAREVVYCINIWAAVWLEFLTRLCCDWEGIKESFSSEIEPGVLIEVSSGAGDSHRGGRSVIISTFSSGFKLVYKPHSLSVDAHFGKLLAWLNEQGSHPPLRGVRVLDMGNYGWAEFLPTKGCTTLEEVDRFYKRIGGYLALLYALEATDFHLENLIACGESPVLVDLEALFHPRGPGNERSSGSLGADALSNSVLRIGLLPQWVWSGLESEGAEMSGIVRQTRARTGGLNHLAATGGSKLTADLLL